MSKCYSSFSLLKLPVFAQQTMGPGQQQYCIGSFLIHSTRCCLVANDSQDLSVYARVLCVDACVTHLAIFIATNERECKEETFKG